MRHPLKPPSEPSRLQQFRSTKAPFAGKLFTCARPGRSLGPAATPISDAIVKDWVSGLPPIRPLHIISLLGKKPPPKDISEYSFYSFRGGLESERQRPGSVTLQQWLDHHYGPNEFIVIDYPTVDTEQIEVETLSAIRSEVNSLLGSSATVIIVDSGGVGRTGKVCATIHAKAI